MKIEDLLNQVKKYNNNLDLIVKAYNFAEKAHYNQLRESGHPHINHLLGACKILADLKMDEVIISSCLLHDVMEDTNFSRDVLKKEFGEEITSLVEGVTKISKITIPDFKERQVENLRKMLIASTKDIRVILIKLADRLDNIHSLQYFREDKQKRIAKETLQVYAPIAYRLGLGTIKWQLEDSAFRYLEPKIYNDLKEKISKKRNEREIEISKIKSIIEKELRKNNIIAEVTGRVKNFYSIYRKIVERNYNLDEMFDLIALRVIVNDVKECYEVLGIIHNLFKPIENRFKDYIANPKPNLYQSLHTCVLFNNDPIEFQVETKEMYKINEEGIAAHWQYKKLSSEEDFEKKLGWIKQILNLNQNKDFLESLKIDLFGDNIFVFTPKNDIIELQKDSTILDFAYAVHTDLGNKCTGARVNGKFVSLKHELKNADIVEILISKNQKPSREWLKFVKSPKSRTKIMQELRLHEKIPVSNLRKINFTNKSIVKSEIKTNFIKLAECCNPIPYNEIIGLTTKNNKITVHKKDCDKINVKKLKYAKVFWNNEPELSVNIKIIAYDRIGLFADILNNISSLHINIEKADAHSVNNNLAECNIKIKINSLDDVVKIIDKVRSLEDIKKVSLN